MTRRSRRCRSPRSAERRSRRRRPRGSRSDSRGRPTNRPPEHARATRATSARTDSSSCSPSRKTSATRSGSPTSSERARTMSTTFSTRFPRNVAPETGEGVLSARRLVVTVGVDRHQPAVGRRRGDGRDHESQYDGRTTAVAAHLDQRVRRRSSDCRRTRQQPGLSGSEPALDRLHGGADLVGGEGRERVLDTAADLLTRRSGSATSPPTRLLRAAASAGSRSPRTKARSARSRSTHARVSVAAEISTTFPILTG